MLVRLLKDHANMRGGTEFVPPWDSQARDLIRRGIAEEVLPGEPRPPEPEASSENASGEAPGDLEPEPPSPPAAVAKPNKGRKPRK